LILLEISKNPLFGGSNRERSGEGGSSMYTESKLSGSEYKDGV
jgi:hypothetical protein